MTQIVSIRVPKKMLQDLKKSANKGYCLDLSEHLRSIIRKKTLEYAFPYKSEIAKIQSELNKNEELKRKRAKKELLQEIQKFLEAKE